MSHYRRFVEHIGFQGLATLVAIIEGLLLIPILTKALGVEDYGVWSQIKFVVVLALPFTLIGLDAAIIRYNTGASSKKKKETRFTTTFIMTLLLSAIVSVVLYLVAPYLAALLTQTVETAKYFRILAAILVLATLQSVMNSFVKSDMRIGAFSVSKIINSMVFLSLSILLLLDGMSIVGVLVAFGAAILTSIIYTAIVSKVWRRFRKPDFSELKKMIRYGYPLTFIPLLNWIFQVSDQYLLGPAAGIAAVGLYAAAFSLANILRALPSPILIVMDSYMIEARNKGDEKALHTYYNYSYKLIFLLVVPAAFGLMALSEPLTRHIMTSEFSASSAILPLLVIGLLLFTYTHIANVFLRVEERTKTIHWLFAALAAGNILLNIILIPMWGYWGAAISTLITFAGGFMFSLGVLIKNGLSLHLGFLTKSLLASTVMTGFVMLGKGSVTSVFSLLTIVAGSALVYFLMIIVLRAFSRNELLFIKKMALSYFDN